ncbi:MAG: ComEC/Rec2 family competence protein, partial [Agathobacter sp.]|nr:ComEC/Rec2 family competence protein [Agathobacter sp.]
MRKRPLLLWACVFGLGLLDGHFMLEGFSTLTIAILAAAAVIACHAVLPYLVQHNYKRLAIRICSLTLIFICGCIHMQSQIQFRERELEQIREGADIFLCGEIHKKEYRKEQLRVYLKNCYAVSKQTEVACNQVILYLQSDEYPIGEILLVNGKVHMFTPATNEGGFDERNFYFSQKIDFAVKDPKIERAAPENSRLAGLRVPTSEWLWRLRQRISEVYRNAMDQALAGVLSVMLVGDKSRIDTETKSLYQKAGISHILAISG